MLRLAVEDAAVEIEIGVVDWLWQDVGVAADVVPRDVVAPGRNGGRKAERGERRHGAEFADDNFLHVAQTCCLEARIPWEARRECAELCARADVVGALALAALLLLVAGTAHADTRGLLLLGNIDVVEGRYLQPFDLKERFLARRVVEEEEPFWRGDA